jgi:phosphinothricin acetyltransferase
MLPLAMPRSSQLAFGAAAPADLPAIVGIYNGTVPSRMVTADLEPVSVESRVRWFEEHASPRSPLLVATDASDTERVLGWISLQDFNPRCAYQGTVELSVYVDEAHRRRGVGRALIEHVCERATELGVDTLVGLVFGHNTPSLALFESLGFERWGLMPGVARLDGVRRDLVFVGRRL